MMGNGVFVFYKCGRFKKKNLVISVNESNKLKKKKTGCFSYEQVFRKLLF